MSRLVRVTCCTLLLAALAACGSARAAEVGPGAQASDTSVVLRRVATGLATYAVFPDGKEVVVADETTGDLAVKDLVTGSYRRLTHAGDGWTHRYLDEAMISPDGGTIAYSWVDSGRISMRTIHVDGTDPRTLYTADMGRTYFWPMGWTPDGQSILAGMREQGGPNRLVRFDLDGGGQTTLRTFGSPYYWGASYAADGRHIALTFTDAQDDHKRIDIWDVASGSLEHLAGGPQQSVALVAWAPGDRAIYFATHREGAASVWRQALHDYVPAGAPELVRSGLAGFRPVGRTAKGLAFSTFDRPFDLYRAQLDPGTGQLVGPPFHIATRHGVWLAELHLSPDGRRIAYTATSYSSLWQGARVAVRSTGGGDERMYGSTRLLDPGVAVWRSDGLYVHVQEKGKRVFYRLDLRTGEFQRVGATLFHPSARGAVRVVAQNATSTLPRRLVTVDSATGSEKVLVTGKGFRRGPISPDGTQVVVLEGYSRIEVYSTTGGPPHELYRTTGKSWIRQAAWLPGGRRLLFLEQDLAGGHPSERLRMVDAGGHVTDVISPLDLPEGDAASGFALSKDGRELVYAVGRGSQIRRELWFMENLPGW